MREHTREDGRPHPQTRPTTVVPSVLARNTVGSAIVRLGDTKVVAGVTIQVGNPSAMAPDCGEVTLSLHAAALNPSEEANESYLKRIIQSSEIIDLTDLCIIPGKAAWRLCVNVEILNHEGNILDAAFLASVAALANVRLPTYQINPDTDQVQIIASSSEKGNYTKSLPLKNIPIPLCVGVFVDKKKKENGTDEEEESTYLLVDPSFKEEQACHGFIHVVVDSNSGKIYSCQTIGPSINTLEQFAACIHMAIGRAKEMTPLIQACTSSAQTCK